MNRKFFTKLVITLFFGISSNLLADNSRPDLWKVEKNGHTSYLFGSIHLGSEDMYPLSKVVNDAYNVSQYLVVEVDVKPEDEAKMVPLVRKYGLDRATPIEKRLSPRTLETYRANCKDKLLACETFAPFKAWLLSVQLTMMRMKKLGYDGELGIDKHFLSRAHKTNKNIISLESAESQFVMLSSFNQQQQELMLIQSMQAEEQEFIALFDAWKSGDDKSMIKMFLKDIEKPGANAMYKKIFDQRNIAMVDGIKRHIAAKKTLFVVVGAGHMVGEMGIINLLENDGFKLSQIQ